MRHALALLAAISLVACGGDSGTGPNPNGSGGTITATVDGSTWAPPSTLVQAAYGNNTFALGGTVTGTPNRQINITVSGVSGPGTFDLGPANPAALALLTFSTGSSSVSTWTTALSPATGSITFSTLTATGAQGSFQFTGQATPGTSATGQKSVTSGSFNVTF